MDVDSIRRNLPAALQTITADGLDALLQAVVAELGARNCLSTMRDVERGRVAFFARPWMPGEVQADATRFDAFLKEEDRT